MSTRFFFGMNSIMQIGFFFGDANRTATTLHLHLRWFLKGICVVSEADMTAFIFLL